jgi:hypothetical protein
MARMAAQEFSAPPVREWHHQAIALAEVQRPLDRRLGLPGLPKTVPDDRFQELGTDHHSHVMDRCRAVEDRRQHRNGSLGISVGDG